MPAVDITIGKRTFQLVCGEGQEERLQGLAAQVSEKVDMLSEQLTDANDSVLLVMTSLMLQDEYNEAKENNSQANGHAGNDDFGKEVDEAVTEAITAISEYVESIAERIENG